MKRTICRPRVFLFVQYLEGWIEWEGSRCTAKAMHCSGVSMLPSGSQGRMVGLESTFLIWAWVQISLYGGGKVSQGGKYYAKGRGTEENKLIAKNWHVWFARIQHCKVSVLLFTGQVCDVPWGIIWFLSCFLQVMYAMSRGANGFCTVIYRSCMWCPVGHVVSVLLFTRNWTCWTSSSSGGGSSGSR